MLPRSDLIPANAQFTGSIVIDLFNLLHHTVHSNVPAQISDLVPNLHSSWPDAVTMVQKKLRCSSRFLGQLHQHSADELFGIITQGRIVLHVKGKDQTVIALYSMNLVIGTGPLNL